MGNKFLSKRVAKTIKQARRLRQKQTPAEKALWRKMRNRRLHNFKFKRQAPIGPYIVDFYCAEKRLIIEIDGSVHSLKWKNDYIREQNLLREGYRVLRFTNQQIYNSMEETLAIIAQKLGIL